MFIRLSFSSIFFFHDTATTEFYTLSYTTLFRSGVGIVGHVRAQAIVVAVRGAGHTGDIVPFLVGRGLCHQDRKSTRLNSSHVAISYAVFCLKKKKLTEVK